MRLSYQQEFREELTWKGGHTRQYEKGLYSKTLPRNTAPLCGLVTDYRTFYEEYMKCVEFYNWLKENGNSI